MEKSAHSFQENYEALGINLSSLGCLMLDLAPPKFIIDEADWISQQGADCAWYFAKNEERHWIKGFVADHPHVTALYGFLESAETLRPHIEAMTKDIQLPTHLEIDHFGTFESPYPDEPYVCIVAHLKENTALLELNERLQMLPHIRTFPGFKAHVTIGYMHKHATGNIEATLKSLEQNRGTECFYVLGLNYGS